MEENDKDRKSAKTRQRPRNRKRDSPSEGERKKRIKCGREIRKECQFCERERTRVLGILQGLFKPKSQ